MKAYHRLRENASHTPNCNNLPHLILVPHEPTVERIDEIQAQLDHLGLSRICFSELQEGVDLSQIDVIVIDTVGLLAQLYRLGDVAFVGGEFPRECSQRDGASGDGKTDSIRSHNP